MWLVDHTSQVDIQMLVPHNGHTLISVLLLRIADGFEHAARA